MAALYLTLKPNYYGLKCDQSINSNAQARARFQVFKRYNFIFKASSAPKLSLHYTRIGNILYKFTILRLLT